MLRGSLSAGVGNGGVARVLSVGRGVTRPQAGRWDSHVLRPNFDADEAGAHPAEQRRGFQHPHGPGESRICADLFAD